MRDGLGSVSYQYDQLSRMTSESRTFTNVGTFALSYGYNPAGQVTSVTDPWSAQVGYTRDITGRLTAVTGSGYSNVSQTGYASDFKYRAWGALKSMTYSNQVPLALTYTNRMQVNNYKLTSPATQGQSPSMDIDYTYSADGRLKLSTDHKDATLDRAYKYDQIGRLVEAFTASEARSWVQNGSIGTTVDGPYRQSYTMDTWGNMTTKWGRSYTGTLLSTQSVNYTYSSTTGRISGWEYDADGRVLGDVDSGTEYHYDEAGGLRETSNSTSGTLFTQDGDGQKAKLVVEGSAAHYLHSSVFGQTIAEINTDGSRKNGFVHADGQLIATQAVGVVFWQHMDASQRSRRTTLAGGAGQGRDEVDPSDVKLDPPNLHQFNQGTGGGGKGAGGGEARVASLADLRMCDLTGGMRVPCAVADGLEEHLSSVGERMSDHWKGITTWTFTVRATFKNGITKSRSWQKRGGFFDQKAEKTSFTDKTLTPSEFEAYAFAMAAEYHWIDPLDEQERQDLKGDKHLKTPAVNVKREYLTDCVKKYLSKFFGNQSLDGIEVQRDYVPPIAPSDARAFTNTGYLISFNKGEYQPNTKRGIELIGHEITHNFQARKYGDSVFGALYLGDSAALLYQFQNMDMAYLGNRFEKEAFAKEEEIQKDLAKNGNPCPP